MIMISSMMSLSPSPSPPPLPSPQLLPKPLLSPPRRLIIHTRSPPQIPPTLVGSPLLEKTIDHARSHDALYRTSRSSRFPDDTPRPEHRRSLHSRTLKRTLSQSSCRCRSPPPSPAIRSPPPPVPPIPAFVLATNHSFTRPSHPPSAPAFGLYLDRPRDAASCESQARSALTCMQFLAVHNSRGQCRV